jgi:amino acid permease
MSATRHSLGLDPEKDGHIPGEPASLGEHMRGRQFSVDGRDVDLVEADQGALHRNLKGRHMQMIAM